MERHLWRERETKRLTEREREIGREEIERIKR